MSIGWGIIGCGELVDNVIAPAIKNSKEGELVAFLSRSQEKAKAFVKKHKAQSAYSRLENFLDDDEVKVVFVGTPPGLHHHAVVRAAQAKKHIFCEKPMATTSQQCREMIEVCDANGVNLMVGYMLRFHSAHKQIKSIISSGEIGKIVILRAQISLDYNGLEEEGWRMNPSLAGGGLAMDGGTHCVDLFRFLNGEIKEVFAFMDTLTLETSLEDTAMVCVRFVNGACGEFEACYNIDIRSSGRYLEVYGDKGYIRAIGTISRYGQGHMEVFRDGKSNTVAIPVQDMYLDEINEFNASIVESRNPVVSGFDGLRNLEVIEAIYRSSKRGVSERIS